MPPAHLIAVGSSPLGKTGLSGRDLFSRALAEAFEHLAPITFAIVELDSSTRLTGRPDAPLEAVDIGDRVEIRVDVHESVDFDSSFTLSYEAEWPLHIFELR